MKHMMGMPAVQACDALSTSTNSTRQGDDADSDGSFQDTEGSIWYNALKKWIPNTLEKYEAEGKAVTKSCGRVKTAKPETTQPKRKATAKAEPVPSGAASSGGRNM